MFKEPIVVLLCAATSLVAAPTPGATVYQTRCASCHDPLHPRVPPRAALQKLSRPQILRSLYFGVMANIARTLTTPEKEAVAEYLGRPGGDAPPLPSALCTSSTATAKLNGSWNGWSPTASQARYQPAGLTISQTRNLKLKWAFGFDGDVTAFGSPTLLDGHLYIGSAAGVVYALNAQTGCLHWTFAANGPVRAAPLAVGQTLLFGDQSGWFYALDAKSGQLRWKRRVDDHEAARLTGSAVAKDGVVFVPVASWEEGLALNPTYACCTFRGSLVALRVADGTVVWKTYLVTPPTKRGVNSAGADRLGPSGAGIWSAPTLDPKRGVLYVTTGDNYSSPATPSSDAIIALNLKSGQIVWTRQTTANDVYTSACGNKGPNCPTENGPDFDFGASAILVTTAGGRDLLLAGQKSGLVYALDPARKGEILWEARVGKGGVLGGVQWGMASDGQQLYAAVSDVVRKTRASTAPDDVKTVTVDADQGGGLTALRITDGKKNWYAPGVPCPPATPGCSPAQSAAVTAVPGAVFSGAFDGHLRAFSAEDGTVIWDFDTARAFATVNGVPAKGGSMDGPGPVIAGGMLFVNSGYSRFGGMPGNVLLAFSSEP